MKHNKTTLNEANQPSILWHDYETWGISPKFDKPSQFAGIRTDLDLNIIGEPEMFYCSPPVDYLPHPEACLVTGITPQKAQIEGLTEAEFSARIHGLFSQPNTCVAGYNNIRFDDEVSRYLFYRNFYDPYAREWQNGNSRWDIIDMVRACYALRPDGINWPTVERDGEQVVSFRLELLTKANGICHEAAHDAMSDVYATIAMAKLIKEKQPKLYDFIFNLKHKKQVKDLINTGEMTPIVHTSSKISSAHGCTSWFAPLTYHPVNKNAVICVDLAQDITPLLDLSSEEIKTRLYTRYDELAPNEKNLIEQKSDRYANLWTAGYAPAGPDGHRGHRTYGRVGGNYGGYYVFGNHMKETPAKVFRWLRIMETMLNDEELLLHGSLGKEGLHWKWQGEGDNRTTIGLEPFGTYSYKRNSEGLSWHLHEKMAGYLVTVPMQDDFVAKYMPAGLIKFRKEHNRIEWGDNCVFGDAVYQAPHDIVARVNKLIAYQQTNFTEFIAGQKDFKNWDKEAIPKKRSF